VERFQFTLEQTAAAYIGPGDFGSPGCERGNGFHKYIFKPSFYVYYAF